MPTVQRRARRCRRRRRPRRAVETLSRPRRDTVCTGHDVCTLRSDRPLCRCRPERGARAAARTIAPISRSKIPSPLHMPRPSDRRLCRSCVARNREANVLLRPSPTRSGGARRALSRTTGRGVVRTTCPAIWNVVYGANLFARVTKAARVRGPASTFPITERSFVTRRLSGARPRTTSRKSRCSSPRTSQPT